MKSDVREMNIFDKPIIDTDRLIEKMSEKQQKRKLREIKIIISNYINELSITSKCYVIKNFIYR